MKLQRYGALAGAALIGMASLSACGSDNNGATTAAGTTPASAAAGATTAAIACGTGTLTMAGSTAQANAISQWTKDYQTACSGATVNYTANGSGAGFTSFSNGQAEVAGSDYPLSSTQQPLGNTHCGTGSTAIDIPAVPGAIAVIFNVPGETSLNLSAKTLAGIFQGTITNWNDPAIAADNKTAPPLPNLPIQVFHRGDTSGTSFNFSNYLNSLDPSFPAANKQWPGTAGTGETGSSAVAAKVKATSGAIGYAEYSYATANSLSYAAVSNAAGAFVQLTQANATNFIAKAKVVQSGSDTRLNFDYTYSDPSAYPNVLVTYEIACSSGNSNASLVKGFLNYIVSPAAQGELTGLGYVPLPSSIAATDQTVISSLS